MANKNIKAFVKGISGAAISSGAEILKKVKNMDKTERKRKQVPTQNRVGSNNLSKGTSTYENGGKQK